MFSINGRSIFNPKDSTPDRSPSPKPLLHSSDSAATATPSSGLSFQRWRETTAEQARGLNPNALANQSYGGYLPEVIRPEDSYSRASATSHNTATSLGKRVADMEVVGKDARKKRRSESPADTQDVDYLAGYTDRLSPAPENETKKAYGKRLGRMQSRRRAAIRANMPKAEKDAIALSIKASDEYRTANVQDRSNLVEKAVKKRMSEIIKKEFDKAGKKLMSETIRKEFDKSVEVELPSTHVDYLAGYTDRLSPAPENETKKAYDKRLGRMQSRRRAAIRANMPKAEKDAIALSIKASDEYRTANAQDRGNLVDKAVRKRMSEIIKEKFKKTKKT